MAIAPGVQRRELHPDGPGARTTRCTTATAGRSRCMASCRSAMMSPTAQRQRGTRSSITNGFQVDKAVGVDRPSRSFVDRQAYPAAPELNRRAGRDAQHDPLPGLEPLDCDAVVMASRDIVAGYATGGCDGVAAAVRRAAAPGSEAVLSEQMWRSRHAIANQALLTAGKLHPDKKIAKAARAALVKANSVRNSARNR
jgi:hypothetical protein